MTRGKFGLPVLPHSSPHKGSGDGGGRLVYYYPEASVLTSSIIVDWRSPTLHENNGMELQNNYETKPRQQKANRAQREHNQAAKVFFFLNLLCVLMEQLSNGWDRV